MAAEEAASLPPPLQWRKDDVQLEGHNKSLCTIFGRRIADFGDLSLESSVPRAVDMKQRDKTLNLIPTSGIAEVAEYMKEMKTVGCVVSFLGATHYGKSFLARNLLCDGNATHGTGPVVGNMDTLLGTTTGCWYYHSEYKRDLHVLDMEGMGAVQSDLRDSEHVPCEAMGKYFRPPHAVQIPPEAIGKTRDYWTCRNAATKEHLPRFAYVVSDVIVFICDGPASDFVIQLISFSALLAAPNRVRPTVRPHCVVVYNNFSNPAMLTVTEEQDLELLTRGFGQFSDLLDHYESIRYVRIPDKNVLPQDFSVRARRFRELVTSLGHERVTKRNQFGLCFPASKWITLAGNLLSQFHSVHTFWSFPILMDSSASDALTPFRRFYYSCLAGIAPHAAKATRYEDAEAAARRTVQFFCARNLTVLQRHTLIIMDELFRELLGHSPCRKRSGDQVCTLFRWQHSRGLHEFPHIIQGNRAIPVRSIPGQFEGADFLDLESSYRSSLEALLAGQRRYQNAISPSFATFLALLEISLTTPRVPVVSQLCTVCYAESSLGDVHLSCGHSYCRRCHGHMQNFFIEREFGGDTLDPILATSDVVIAYFNDSANYHCVFPNCAGLFTKLEGVIFDVSHQDNRAIPGRKVDAFHSDLVEKLVVLPLNIRCHSDDYWDRWKTIADEFQEILSTIRSTPTQVRKVVFSSPDAFQYSVASSVLLSEKSRSIERILSDFGASLTSPTSPDDTLLQILHLLRPPRANPGDPKIFRAEYHIASYVSSSGTLDLQRVHPLWLKLLGFPDGIHSTSHVTPFVTPEELASNPRVVASIVKEMNRIFGEAVVRPMGQPAPLQADRPQPGPSQSGGSQPDSILNTNRFISHFPPVDLAHVCIRDVYRCDVGPCPAGKCPKNSCGKTFWRPPPFFTDIMECLKVCVQADEEKRKSSKITVEFLSGNEKSDPRIVQTREDTFLTQGYLRKNGGREVEIMNKIEQGLWEEVHAQLDLSDQPTIFAITNVLKVIISSLLGAKPDLHFF